MKIYICDAAYENNHGIFVSQDAALAHLDECRGCEVVELELVGDEFKFTNAQRIGYKFCLNCGERWRSDQKEFVTWEHESFCNETCRAETEQFYADGNYGIHGKTTRETILHYALKIKQGRDPNEGLASTGSGCKSELKIFTPQ